VERILRMGELFVKACLKRKSLGHLQNCGDDAELAIG
jgi:hypothetical protein